MSDYRFGDDYRLNYDHERQNTGDDYDYVDWNTVEWVEIDGAMFVAERTCRKVPGKMHYGTRRPKCSECGYGLGDSRWSFCPNCGAKVAG